MIDTDALRGIIASRRLSQRKVARQLGITEATFYRKMREGVFISTEMEAMVEILGIEDPCSIFFKPNVA